MNINHFYRYVTFLTGALVTAPILAVTTAGTLISLFSLTFIFFLLLTFLYALKADKRWRPNVYIIVFGAWLFACLGASFFGILYFSGKSEWQRAVISYIPKITLFILLFIATCQLHNASKVADNFMRGLLLGFSLNMIWVLAEGILFYSNGTVLNDLVFAEYAKTLPDSRPTMTIVADGIIRASGFNYDPAHMGGIIPITLLYAVLRKNVFLIGLSLIALVLSGSTTAAVSSLTAILFTIGKLKLFDLSHINFAPSLRKTIPFLFIILVVFLGNPFLLEGLIDNAYGFYNRVETHYIQNADQGPRAIYHLYLPQALYNAGPMLITGTGLGTGSLPYVSDGSTAQLLGEYYYPYDPESTYISYLFDLGIGGLIAYLVILFLCFQFYRRRIGTSARNDLIYSVLCGIIISGFFYHYIMTAYQIITLIFAVVLTSKRYHPT